MSKNKKKRDCILFIEDVLNCIKKIEKYTKGLSFEEFCKNDMAADAIIRNFEVIGEALKKIPEEIKKRHSDVEWKEAAGFREVLIHDYFGIDLESVWDTVKNNIPSFKRHISKVFKSEKRTDKIR